MAPPLWPPCSLRLPESPRCAPLVVSLRLLASMAFVGIVGLKLASLASLASNVWHGLDGLARPGVDPDGLASSTPSTCRGVSPSGSPKESAYRSSRSAGLRPPGSISHAAVPDGVVGDSSSAIQPQPSSGYPSRITSWAGYAVAKLLFQ